MDSSSNELLNQNLADTCKLVFLNAKLKRGSKEGEMPDIDDLTFRLTDFYPGYAGAANVFVGYAEGSDLSKQPDAGDRLQAFIDDANHTEMWFEIDPEVT